MTVNTNTVCQKWSLGTHHFIIFLLLFGLSDCVWAQKEVKKLDDFSFELGKVYVDLNSKHKRNFNKDGTRKTKEQKIKEIKTEYEARGETIAEDDIVFLSEEFIKEVRKRAKSKKQAKTQLDEKYEFSWAGQKNGGTVKKDDLEKDNLGKLVFGTKDGEVYDIQAGMIHVGFTKAGGKGHDTYSVPILEGGKLTDETLASVEKAGKTKDYIKFEDLIVSNKGKRFKVPVTFTFVFE